MMYLTLISVLIISYCCLRLFLNRHLWSYHNKHNRYCTACGRHELRGAYEWKTIHAGNQSKHGGVWK